MSFKFKGRTSTSERVRFEVVALQVKCPQAFAKLCLEHMISVIENAVSRFQWQQNTLQHLQDDWVCGLNAFALPAKLATFGETHVQLGIAVSKNDVLDELS